jgi:hypothetical protein
MHVLARRPGIGGELRYVRKYRCVLVPLDGDEDGELPAGEVLLECPVKERTGNGGHWVLLLI